MGINFSNFTSDTIQDAITRGDDYFILEGNASASWGLGFDTVASIKAMAIGGFSDFDMVDVTFAMPVREYDGESAPPFDSRIRVGVKSPFFGRVPINGFLGETVTMSIDACQDNGTQTTNPPNGDFNQVDTPRCGYQLVNGTIQLICYLTVPPFVNTARAPKVISRTIRDLDGGLGVTVGYLRTFGRRSVKVKVQNLGARGGLGAVTASITRFKGIQGYSFDQMSQTEVLTLGTADRDTLEWGRSEDGDMPDMVALSVGGGIDSDHPVFCSMETRD